MLEDLRNHDATPTDEETAWMTGSVTEMLVQSAMMVAIAMTVGMVVSHAVDVSDTRALVAQTTTR